MGVVVGYFIQNTGYILTAIDLTAQGGTTLVATGRHCFATGRIAVACFVSLANTASRQLFIEGLLGFFDLFVNFHYVIFSQLAIIS